VALTLSEGAIGIVELTTLTTSLLRSHRSGLRMRSPPKPTAATNPNSQEAAELAPRARTARSPTPKTSKEGFPPELPERFGGRSRERGVLGRASARCARVVHTPGEHATSVIIRRVGLMGMDVHAAPNRPRPPPAHTEADLARGPRMPAAPGANAPLPRSSTVWRMGPTYRGT